MNSNKDQKDEFYIGWQPAAPVFTTTFIRRCLVLVAVSVVCLALILVIGQSKFSTAIFEYGKTKSLSGIYSSSPVPHLLLKNESEFIMVPLVGYGKFGAEGTMHQLAREMNASFEKKWLELRGTLLYGDGKLLMQVDQSEQPVISIKNTALSVEPQQTVGSVLLKGEIIDPKCYFGVMKPGEGKAHKDCAIRCISGGIPPVLAVRHSDGSRDYILLHSKAGSINEIVKDFIATPVQISGVLKNYYNWKILEVNELQFLKPEQNTITAVADCGTECCTNISL